MSVEIPAEFQLFVEGMVAEGGFPDEAHVVGEALRLLQERQRRLKALREEIQIGLDQLDRGEFTDYDDESLKQFFEDIKSEGRQRLSAAGNAE